MKTPRSKKRVSRPASTIRATGRPIAADPELLQAMSLSVPTRGGGRKQLTGEEIERALISGEHARVLETYFGEVEYAELTALAARAARQVRRGAPRVLILPGVLGSTLARMRGSEPDILWVDFWDMARGRLAELALPDIGKTIRAVDAHPGTYLKMKLWLRAEGFDAETHAFDWRASLPELGAQLARRVAHDPAGEVWLIAHSMGGLVARAALSNGLPKLKRLIMLGAPNYGSFVPVMVFRGVYRFLKIIALLDLAHSPKELAGKVFNTFPGLTELMPQREKFNSVDLYDIRAWPTQGPRPLEALLKSAPKVQARLKLPPSGKTTVIAGVDQKTTTGLRVQGNEFVFEQTNNGDGTVPLDFALLPGLDTFFVRESHGELPRNKKVWQAVKELMRGDPVTLLERQWSRSRSGVTLVTESELAATQQALAAERAAELRPADLRNFIEEFAAGPRAAEASPGPLAAVTISAGAPALPAATISEVPFSSLVVSRRRQRRVEIRLARGSLTRVKSRAYVVGLFQEVQPAGATLAIDAAMNSAVTDFSRRRMMSNAVGEVFMLPAGRTELRADMVLFTGLGAFDRFNAQVLETVAENLARSLVHANLEEFATVLMGANTGLDIEAAAIAYIRGFLRGLVDTDEDQNFRAITICEIDEARYEALKWVLYRLASGPLFTEVEVTFTEIGLPAAPVVPAVAAELPRADALGAVLTIYLHVRSLRVGNSGWRFFTSVMTSGAKATVIGGEIEVSSKKLDAHLARIEGAAFNHAKLPEFGRQLAGLVLPADVIAALEGSASQHLVIIHDAEASRIPWETLHIGGRAPALEAGMSRRYIAANMSVAKWLEHRRQSPTLNILLVINPTSDLPGAAKEGERIKELCQAKNSQVDFTEIKQSSATCARLIEEFRSGQYDVLHYAGHAFFDPATPSRSGLVCADGHLTGADLASLATLPNLVFFNACESARVRRRVKKTRHPTHNLRQRLERSAGLAEAFLRGGVANYLGTYWPVGDAAADTFAGVFYTALLEGVWLGRAVQKARNAVNAIASPDWADYLQYGSFEFALKFPSTKERGSRIGD
ncbi:MAG: CHAT domain-containing protein [Verrucomicrobiales bacterium]